MTAPASATRAQKSQQATFQVKREQRSRYTYPCNAFYVLQIEFCAEVSDFCERFSFFIPNGKLRQLRLTQFPRDDGANVTSAALPFLRRVVTNSASLKFNNIFPIKIRIRLTFNHTRDAERRARVNSTDVRSSKVGGKGAAERGSKLGTYLSCTLQRSQAERHNENIMSEHLSNL